MSRESVFREDYGPWAVVTGASDGIGRAIAVELAERGLSLVLVARREDRLQALAQELSTPAQVVALDLCRPSAVGTLLKATAGLDVGLVVASAGFGTSGAFAATEVATELDMVDVNCRSVVELVHAFTPPLLQRKRGGFILLSSLVAFQGVPRATTYAATKAFMQSFAEGLRLELGGRGVDVLSCAPGPVASGFGARADMRMSGALEPTTVARETVRALGRKAIVRPGLMSKILELSLSMLPRWARSRIVGQVMLGMTKHQPALPAL